ncbi:MAG TPA: SynChlorMet cassette protein ScmC [Syntrophorhabdales bacterium]|nr:SynChlorMet cassette protein ScmC [Syntrophorhabdales bacterium]
MYDTRADASFSAADAQGSYLLRLADGQGWEIIAGRGAELWVRKLASIMRLAHCASNGYPKLVFMRKSLGRDWWRDPVSGLAATVAENLPEKGWIAHDLISLHLWAHNEVPDVLCEMGDEEDHDLDIVRMWLGLAPVYNRTLELGGLPLHSALVERNGTAVLLAGPGGTGKSTCCRRIPPPWKALCDDLSLAVQDEDEHYRVHPFPTWSNYLWKLSEGTWDVQQHLPLSAMFFLEQWEYDEVEELGQGQASILITESAQQICQTAWRNLIPEEERGLKEKLFQNACAVAGTIPIFKLRVSLEGRFWETMERVLF